MRYVAVLDCQEKGKKVTENLIWMEKGVKVNAFDNSMHQMRNGSLVIMGVDPSKLVSFD